MREILFRGKRPDGIWVYGYYFAKPILEFASIICGEKQWAVDPNTVGQYTGLTDKNGVKIFDGDIVHVHDVTLKRTDPWHEFDGYVAFADGSYCIVSGSASHDRWFRYYVDVIGNVHDDPELLEGGDST